MHALTCIIDFYDGNPSVVAYYVSISRKNVPIKSREVVISLPDVIEFNDVHLMVPSLFRFIRH